MFCQDFSVIFWQIQGSGIRRIYSARKYYTEAPHLPSAAAKGGRFLWGTITRMRVQDPTLPDFLAFQGFLHFMSSTTKHSVSFAVRM
jgi:hypothetical protein